MGHARTSGHVYIDSRLANPSTLLWASTQQSLDQPSSTPSTKNFLNSQPRPLATKSRPLNTKRKIFGSRALPVGRATTSGIPGFEPEAAVENHVWNHPKYVNQPFTESL
jgi:hypothetical protein